MGRVRGGALGLRMQGRCEKEMGKPRAALAAVEATAARSPRWGLQGRYTVRESLIVKPVMHLARDR